MSWLSTQFNENMLFRRLYLFFMGIYVFMVTYFSFQYLFIATEQGVGSIDIVANITATVAFPTMVMGYMFNKYNEAKKQ